MEAVVWAAICYTLLVVCVGMHENDDFSKKLRNSKNFFPNDFFHFPEFLNGKKALSRITEPGVWGGGCLYRLSLRE
jgi:hypothetical protein